MLVVSPGSVVPARLARTVPFSGIAPSRHAELFSENEREHGARSGIEHAGKDSRLRASLVGNEGDETRRVHTMRRFERVIAELAESIVAANTSG